MSKFKLEFHFDTDEMRDSFISWYLDGGGNDGFCDYSDHRGLPAPECDAPDSAKLWDWQETEGGPTRQPPLETYRIQIKAYEAPEDDEDDK